MAIAIALEQKPENKKTADENTKDIFDNIDYICGSTGLIVESLQRGLDVAQLSNGDVMITEVKVVNTQYSWDQNKKRMVKISQG